MSFAPYRPKMNI